MPLSRTPRSRSVVADYVTFGLAYAALMTVGLIAYPSVHLGHGLRAVVLAAALAFVYFAFGVAAYGLISARMRRVYRRRDNRPRVVAKPAKAPPQI